jgi:hypothetical protein
MDDTQAMERCIELARDAAAGGRTEVMKQPWTPTRS